MAPAIFSPARCWWARKVVPCTSASPRTWGPPASRWRCRSISAAAGRRESCLGYRLSIDDGFPHSGRMGVSYGEMSSVELIGGGESLRLSVVVARAHTRDFAGILMRHRRPSA